MSALGAALAYYTIFSIAPLLIIVSRRKRNFFFFFFYFLGEAQTRCGVYRSDHQMASPAAGQSPPAGRNL